MTTLKNRILVTAALPYANGRAHVGHIAGCYLPADTFVRFVRLTGREAIFVCGSDEYGAPITFAAIKEGVTPEDIVNRYHQALSEDFSGLGINFDIYGRTTSSIHNEVAQSFFKKLHDLGHVIKRTIAQVFCTKCNIFLPDRYIEGTCHFCGKGGARGDQCEACGRPIEATKLTDPTCMVCQQQQRNGKGSIEVRETDHWYLQLNTYEKELRDYLDRHPEWRDAVKRFSYGLLDQGLRERCVTRDLSWGIPVPIAQATGKVLYVWFDAPIGYITFTKQYFAQKNQHHGWRDFWENDETSLVHFIGKDNTVFHAVMFPAMLLAHGNYRLPDTVVANEFLNLEKEKISTSRNYAVWVHEFLQLFAPDVLRYYLTAIAPEAADSDFAWKGLQARNNGELADNLGNFIQRNLAFCNKYFDSKIPELTIAINANGEKLLAQITATVAEVGELLSTHHYKEALEKVMLLSRAGNEFFSIEEPWKTRKDNLAQCAVTIYVCVQVIESLSILIAPFMPFSAAKLRDNLNLPAIKSGDWNAPRQIISGHQIKPAEVLFPKIDDAIIDEQIAKLKLVLAL